MSYFITLGCGLLSVPVFLLGVLIIGIATILEEVVSFLKPLAKLAVISFIILVGFTLPYLFQIGQGGQIGFVLGIAAVVVPISLTVILLIISVMRAIIGKICLGIQRLGEFFLNAGSKMIGNISKHSEKE